ncbi:hypothetical protein MRB53_020985 [Persea americana]|uniref:Uncharacterized protein n=1 Tax=Persea americana TaxID=3435 RepID=A0ACC2L2S1_PERAE|nr:hypothetical protein MRB53_020985 [Persea americana]
MSQENRGNSSATPVSVLPAKRRRGRPRKDENRNYMAKAPATPVSDLPRRSRHVSTESAAHTDNALVGQIVSGVLDGSFDAGYLLTVKVGNTNTILRGVVFEPGLSVPISADNDVAPHVKMFRRSEMPLPVIIPLQQVPASSTPYHEVKIEQLTKPIPKPVTAIPLEGSLSGNTSLPKRPSDDINHVSQVAPQDNQSIVRTESSDILPSKGVDGAHQTPPVASLAASSNIEKEKSTDILFNKTGLASTEAVNSNQSPPIAAQATKKLDITTLTNKSSDELNQALQDLPSEPKTESPVVVLQESKTSLLTMLSNGATATNDLKLEPETKQSVEVTSGEKGKGWETINQVSQVQTNNLESAVNLDPSVNVLKGVPAEINHPPLATPIGVSQENKTSPFDGSACANIQAHFVAPQETISSVSNEILKRHETTRLIEESMTDAIDTTKDDLQTQPMTNAPYNMQSGYAVNQPTLSQHSIEQQSYDQTALTQEESLITKDAVSMQAPGKPVELVTSTGLMEPTEAADHMQWGSAVLLTFG